MQLFMHFYCSKSACPRNWDRGRGLIDPLGAEDVKHMGVENLAGGSTSPSQQFALWLFIDTIIVYSPQNSTKKYSQLDGEAGQQGSNKDAPITASIKPILLLIGCIAKFHSNLLVSTVFTLFLQLPSLLVRRHELHLVCKTPKIPESSPSLVTQPNRWSFFVIRPNQCT